MIPLFRTPNSIKPDVNYKNFSEPYVSNLDLIIETAEPHYVKTNHLFVQLIELCSTSDDLEYYYRSSVESLNRFLIQHRYSSFQTLGRMQDPTFFAEPITEVVLHHSEFPGTKLFLDSTGDPYAYTPVKLIYHPFTTLHYRFFNGRGNPMGDIEDPYAYYIINIPELVLQWRSYRKSASALDEEVSISKFVSLFIITPFMKQYADISLFNRYKNTHTGLPYNPDPKDNRFGFSTYNDNLLQRGIERNKRTNHRFTLTDVLALVPTLGDTVTFYTTNTTTESLNGRPFMDLSRIVLLIFLFKMLDSDEERHTRSYLKVYIKRMIKGREYNLFAGKHYPYFEHQLEILKKLIKS